MFITSLCGPAIIYIGFSLIQIVMDLYKNLYSSAFIKLIVMLILALTINVLCEMGFVVIAWFLVFIPIIMMTIISALLLKTFGLNPNEDYLSSKVVDASNNLEQEEIIIRDINVERIDRDDERKKFYDKIEEVYDLSSNEENLYDLSNNKKKYFYTDLLINDYGNNFFNDALNKFYYSKFNFLKRTNLNNNVNPMYAYSNTNTPYLNNIPMKIHYETRIDNMNGSDFESYEKKYANRIFSGKSHMNLGGEGYFIYHNQEKRKLQINNPRKSSEEIDIEIEKSWNNLSASEQNSYNREALNSKKESIYDPNNFNSYRS